MRFELCLVFVIFLTLNVSQENVQGSSNIGLVVQNLTRLPTNETCDLNNRNCKYYMKLCFSLAKNDNCSLFDRISLTWVLKPGQSKILKLGDDVVQYIENPLKFPEVNMWKAQEVILRAGVRKSSHPDFTEEILIKEKLPYPINDIKRLEENTITNCSAHFCLTIALYMWCDDIPGCIAINPATTLIKATASSITIDNLTSSSLIQATSSITSGNETTIPSIKVTNYITSGNPTKTRLIQATSSITSDLKTVPVKADNSSTIVIISATVGSGMLLSIIVIALLIKCKRRNLAGKLSAPEDIPPQPIEIPQESLLTDQLYETVGVVHPELKDYVNPSRNESTDILAEGRVTGESTMSSQNPDYTELNKDRLRNSTNDDDTYQKLLRGNPEYVIPAHERRKLNQDMKQMEKSPPDYEELDLTKRETDGDTYQKLLNLSSDYEIPAHERKEVFKDVEIENSQSNYEELNQSKREAEKQPIYQSLVKP